MAIGEGHHIHPTCPSWPSRGSAELVADHCHVIAWAFFVRELGGKRTIPYSSCVGLGNTEAVLDMPWVYSSSMSGVRPAGYCCLLYTSDAADE